MTLTDSRMEIANRVTTLYYLDTDPARAGPLPFGDKAGYNGFFKLFVDPTKGFIRKPYSELTNGRIPTIVGKMEAAFYDNKYWRLVLKNPPSPKLAWANSVPIVCSLTPTVTLTAGSEFKARIQLRPRVLLFPFAWSVWMSIRVLDGHTLEDLSRLANRAFKESAWGFGSEQDLRLQDVFDRIGDGIHKDAFGGDDTDTSESWDSFITTTVLAKNGGSPSLSGIDEETQLAIKRLVASGGKESQKPLASMAVALHSDKDLDYLIAHDYGRFIWMEHLLSSGESPNRNYQWLNCYHQNSFFSVIQAWHLASLLAEAKKVPNPPARLTMLVASAKQTLSDPAFLDASLRAYLEMPELKKLLEEEKK